MDNELSIATMKLYLKDEELHYRRAVAEHLERLADSINIFPANLARELLYDKDDYIKEKAIKILSQIPETLTETDILCILMQLKSKNQRLRDVVLGILPCLYWYISRENVLSFIPLLANNDEHIRRDAAEAIADLMHCINCTRIDEVVSEIIPLLWHADGPIREEAAWLLSFIGQDDVLNQLSANQSA